jgi:hypothetical protein
MKRNTLRRRYGRAGHRVDDELLEHLDYIHSREPWNSHISGPATERLIALGYVRRRPSSVRGRPSQELTPLGRTVLAATKAVGAPLSRWVGRA